MSHALQIPPLPRLRVWLERLGNVEGAVDARRGEPLTANTVLDNGLGGKGGAGQRY